MRAPGVLALTLGAFGLLINPVLAEAAPKKPARKSVRKAAVPPQPAPKSTAAKDAAEAVRLTLQPGGITLEGPRSLQHLVATAHLKDGAALDVSESADYALSNPKLAKIERGVLLPVADGQGQ